MADIKALEYSTLKVPYEILNKKFRAAQKVIDREVSLVVNASNDLTNGLGSVPVKVGEITGFLDGVVQKLQSLKRKSEECLSQEEACLRHCRARLDHIKEHANGRKSAELVWKKKRLDRMLVDHCLRSGYYETAIKLAKDSQIEEFVDIELFLISRKVEESLLRREIGPCLAWCYENKSKLRKFKSNLEFNVRMQEFIELVRRGDKMEAVRYARKHFPPANVDGTMTKEIQRAMALLAFKPGTSCSPYRELFDLERWAQLVMQFRRENFQLHQLNDQSALAVTLQAGLSALKTPHCYQEGHKSSECPVCSHPLNILGRPLPYAHCAQSRLVCPMSGHIMNENNPPMVLPNGYVYGENALRGMANENDGRVTCPKTKETFRVEQADKVYVM
ncbi:macrophage erythroblast attacher-like [Stylophora pistillata]|uniref:E3 ubiquitin-protein transferase MAEA n=1 Tax=Stylophora pistillata TaxID=50429 RepID=A0A2B4S6D9_STYPI|nr:macrophage erythroblast attacher-like [Stylophora pistillata]PFX25471.1 Macrophage erythroblast attacher [Stylophora pistillata]